MIQADVRSRTAMESAMLPTNASQDESFLQASYLASDISHKFENLQKKLLQRPGVTSHIINQNDYVINCMQELQALDPLKGGEDSTDAQVDTTQSVAAAKRQFNRIQAQIRKIVASREEYIYEIHEGQPSEHQIYD